MVHFDWIEYTVHARRRMVERSISEDVVTGVLSSPDLTYIDADAHVAERLGPENKPIRVIYTVRQDPTFGLIIRVISVYRIRKLKVL